eukprot:COSAG05_NODE_19617_length_290_cov_0.769634_1_plen_85_part_10
MYLLTQIHFGLTSQYVDHAVVDWGTVETVSPVSADTPKLLSPTQPTQPDSWQEMESTTGKTTTVLYRSSSIYTFIRVLELDLQMQ